MYLILQPIAIAIGDWFLDRKTVKAINYAYPMTIPSIIWSSSSGSLLSFVWQFGILSISSLWLPFVYLTFINCNGNKYHSRLRLQLIRSIYLLISHFNKISLNWKSKISNWDCSFSFLSWKVLYFLILIFSKDPKPVP